MTIEKNSFFSAVRYDVMLVHDNGSGFRKFHRKGNAKKSLISYIVYEFNT